MSFPPTSKTPYATIDHGAGRSGAALASPCALRAARASSRASRHVSSAAIHLPTAVSSIIHPSVTLTIPSPPWLGKAPREHEIAPSARRDLAPLRDRLDGPRLRARGRWVLQVPLLCILGTR